MHYSHRWLPTSRIYHYPSSQTDNNGRNDLQNIIYRTCHASTTLIYNATKKMLKTTYQYIQKDFKRILPSLHHSCSPEPPRDLIRVCSFHCHEVGEKSFPHRLLEQHAHENLAILHCHQMFFNINYSSWHFKLLPVKQHSRDPRSLLIYLAHTVLSTDKCII